MHDHDHDNLIFQRNNSTTFLIPYHFPTHIYTVGIPPYLVVQGFRDAFESAWAELSPAGDGCVLNRNIHGLARTHKGGGEEGKESGVARECRVQNKECKVADICRYCFLLQFFGPPQGVSDFLTPHGDLSPLNPHAPRAHVCALLIRSNISESLTR